MTDSVGVFVVPLQVRKFIRSEPGRSVVSGCLVNYNLFSRPITLGVTFKSLHIQACSRRMTASNSCD